MNVAKWFRFFIKPNRNQLTDDYAIAKSFAPIAGTWLLPLGIVQLDGPKWAAKEPNYMSGYLQGYGDVLAQSMGREGGSNLGVNIALQFAVELFDGTPVNSFIEFSQNANGLDYDLGLVDGAEDANGFVSNKTQLANALGKHFGI